MRTKIFFRAEGNSEKGLGHIVRCLSVVEMVKDEFDCSMIVNNTDDRVLHFIKQTCSVNDIKVNSISEEFVALGKLLNAKDIFVFDGYSFDSHYQKSVKKLIKKMVAIDDLADKKFEADIIINHGDIKVLPPYQTTSGTKIYSGFDYLIVRAEFLNAVKNKRKVSAINTVFICMGGADPFNITVKVLKASLQCTFLQKIVVVTGSVYNYKNDLKALISASKNKIINHIENANAEQIVNSIGESQIAISTASSISLEICCVKAALLCGTVIDNQYSIHSQLLKNECCVSIGDWTSVTVRDIKQQLEKMNDLRLVQKIIDTQSRCIDGKSAERIRKIFNELAA